MVVGTTDLHPLDDIRGGTGRETRVGFNIERGGAAPISDVVVKIQCHHGVARLTQDADVDVVGLTRRDVGWVGDGGSAAGWWTVLPVPVERLSAAT